MEEIDYITINKSLEKISTNLEEINNNISTIKVKLENI
jgi:hypothetical protein